jgi:hypothetical protein
MSAARHMEPEWLDELPQSDPRAIRSRRDLRRINSWMLQPAIMARALRTHWNTRTPRTILDLGAGDGSFMLRVAARLAPAWQDVRVILLDRQDLVSEATRAEFGSLRWHAEPFTADVLDAVESGGLADIDIVTVNLFLHHLSAAQLEQLFVHMARLTRLFVACEPRRAGVAVIASRLVGMIGCNDVSRHDAVASVRAGFVDSELCALWPNDCGWRLRERLAGPFTHCFVAQRDDLGPMP